jgi:uncharacterized membrane-anchored protein YitT (DUF2179 family)
MAEAAGAVPRHRWYEDLLAVLLGAMVMALGVNLYAAAGLLTGSLMGLSLLLDYLSGWPFAGLFVLLNLPFFVLARLRLGWAMTLRSAVAVLLISVLSRLTAGWIGFSHLDPLYAAIAGGGLMGCGMLILFRHRTSLGGISILALFLQERHGMRAGYVQMAIDATVLLAALLSQPPLAVLLSLLGALVLNLIIALNHRPGRYVAVN